MWSHCRRCEKIHPPNQVFQFQNSSKILPTYEEAIAEDSKCVYHSPKVPSCRR